MSKSTLQDFLVNRALIALKLSSSDLDGLFRKRFVIPKDTAGLALYADGAVALLAAGQEASGRFDLILVKCGDVPMRHPLPDLRAQDGFAVQCTIGFSVAVQTDRHDLFKDFTRAFFNFPGVYGASDLKTALLPEVKRVLTEYVAARPASELHKRDHFAGVETAMRAGLERCLFGTGVRLVRLTEILFSAPDFVEHAAAEARRADDQRRHAEKVGRKEEQLKRIANLLNDNGIRDILATLPDDRLKGLFYARLMADDTATLSPQEVAAKIAEGGDNLGELVYRAMEGVLGGGGASVDAGDIAPETAETVFVALGSKVLAIDVAKPEASPREFTFKEPLRSVRCVDGPDGPVLLVGAKRSVHAVALSDGATAEYPLPDGPAPRGGVNAVAALGPHIYATHSEFGLLRWERAKPGTPGERLWPELTSKHKTTRAVLAAGDRLVFATGDRVYVHTLNNGPAPAEYPTGLDAQVTSLTCGGEALFAGTESGAVVAWKLGLREPSVLVRRRDSILNLRLAKIASIPHLFYGTKDVSVRARVLGQNLETSYESGGPSLGVVDAASDLVAASDSAGRRVFLWKANHPAKPAHDVDVARYSDKPVLDISLRKAPARAE